MAKDFYASGRRFGYFYQHLSPLAFGRINLKEGRGFLIRRAYLKMEILIDATPEELKQLSKRDCTAPAEKNCKGFISNIPSVPVDARSSIRLSAATALAAGILDNRKKILNPSNTDEYLDVAREIMRLAKAYCKAVEQDTEEGDLGDNRAKGT